MDNCSYEEALKDSKTVYANMLDYFWFERGDIERYVRWNEQRMEEDFPDILKAWKDYKTAEKQLNRLIKSYYEEAQFREWEEEALNTLIENAKETT